MNAQHKKLAMTFAALLVPIGMAVAQSPSPSWGAKFKPQGTERTQERKVQKTLSHESTLATTQKEAVKHHSPFPVFRRTIVKSEEGKKASNYAKNLPSTTDDDDFVVEPDWVETFEDENDFNELFTVLDANNDGNTWSYANRGSVRGTVAAGPSQSDNGNDDWLFTPAIHLKKGWLYKVSFTLNNGSSRATLHSTIEVKWGRNKTPGAMTETILETTDPPHDLRSHGQPYSQDITVPADGNYYIGFHDNSEAGRVYLTVTDISVKKGSSATQPAAATNITVNPAPLGRLSADITFNAPNKSINDDDLTSVDSIQILRDGTHIATLPQAEGGAALSYTDSTMTDDGIYKYEVVAYLNGNTGQSGYAQAYVGVDVPLPPANLKLLDNKDNIKVVWDPASSVGANGGYVDPNDVNVTVYKVEPSFLRDHVGDFIAGSEVGATSLLIQHNPEETMSGDSIQELFNVFARATNSKGSGDYYESDPLPIGPSLKLPFKESMKNAKLDNASGPWISGNDQWLDRDHAPAWWVVEDKSSDNDGGSMFLNSYVTQTSPTDFIHLDLQPGDVSSVNMPKVTLNGAQSPKLYFDLYATENDSVIQDVKIQTPDGNLHTEKTIDMSTLEPGWHPEIIDLSQYVSERYIIVRFSSNIQAQSAVIGLDDINIYDQLENNLAISELNVPKETKSGRTIPVEVIVSNLGASPASNYSVVLYSGDKVISTTPRNQSLALLRADTVSLSLPVGAMQNGDLSVKAQVVFDGDLDESDNTATKTVKVEPSNYTTVNDLAATPGTDGVSLNWTKPGIPDPIQTTEDFESYNAFSTEFGEWTLVDGDKGKCGGFFEGYPYPGQGNAFAYIVLNPAAISSEIKILENNPGFTPHSGNQFAAAIFATNGGMPLDADNWMISPELSGRKQTVKFYVFNVATAYENQSTNVFTEDYEVLYSKTNDSIPSFRRLKSGVADGSNAVTESPNWKEVSVELPEGAKYFAIHHITPQSSGLVFGVDDISFEKLAPGTNDSIIGFNIYRNGALIGSVDKDAVTFNDKDEATDGTVYNVTTVYKSNEGVTTESAYSNDATIHVANGISEIKAGADGLYNVYTIDGRAVRINSKTLGGLPKGLYIINNRKYVVK